MNSFIKSGWYFHVRHGLVYVIKGTDAEGIAVRKGFESREQYGPTFVVSRRELLHTRKVKV